jgi:hypothetical protein
MMRRLSSNQRHLFYGRLGYPALISLRRRLDHKPFRPGQPLPGIFDFGPADGRTIQTPWFLSDLELAENSDFQKNYRERSVSISVKNIPGYEYYKRTYTGILHFTYYEKKKTR